MNVDADNLIPARVLSQVNYAHAPGRAERSPDPSQSRSRGPEGRKKDAYGVAGTPHGSSKDQSRRTCVWCPRNSPR